MFVESHNLSNGQLPSLADYKLHTKIHLGDGNFAIERIKIIPSSEVQHLQMLLEKIVSGEIGIKKEGKYHFNNFQNMEIKQVKKRKEVDGVIAEKDITDKVTEMTDENAQLLNQMLEELIAKIQKLNNATHKDPSTEIVSERSVQKREIREPSHPIPGTSSSKRSNKITEHKKLILQFILSEILSAAKQSKIRRAKEKRKKIREEMAQELKYAIRKSYVKTVEIINDQKNLNPVHPLRSRI